MARPDMAKETIAQQDARFDAEHDVRTLRDAADIKADKPRLKRAMAMAKQQMAALKAVSKE